MLKMKNDLVKYNDEELILLISCGKRNRDDVFTEFFRRHSGRIYTYCRCMFQNTDDAKDAFQETFISFYKNIDKLQSPLNICGYLLTIARNLCYNKIRNKKQALPVFEDTMIIDERSNYERNELFQLILSSLDLLDETFRDAFILHEIDGMSYSEISEILNIKKENAKKRVYRAKDKLINILQPYLKELT
ncbi:MAG: hypothetical protein QG635_2249 [Bacteroidota bacterium]|nr:hypothetical protein [Bacteroidota bacterium]